MKKQLLLLLLTTGFISGFIFGQAENSETEITRSGEKCLIEDNLVEPVENLDFNETLFMLQREKRHGANYDKAVATINKIIQEKKRPVAWHANYKGIVKTAVGSICSLAGIIGFNLSYTLATDPASRGYGVIVFAPLALSGFVISGVLTAGGLSGLRGGAKEFSLPYHRDYPKALAIKALLDCYKDQIIYCK